MDSFFENIDDKYDFGIGVVVYSERVDGKENKKEIS